jgi:hypothetical protein
MMVASVAGLPLILPRHFADAVRLQVSSTDMVTMFGLASLFFVIVFIVIVVAIARSPSRRGRVQRPLSEVTAFPPPPPPDTVMVKCEYCGTEQTWKETCVRCGAPMPKPKI